jgi:hypothetical protein
MATEQCRVCRHYVEREDAPDTGDCTLREPVLNKEVDVFMYREVYLL